MRVSVFHAPPASAGRCHDATAAVAAATVPGAGCTQWRRIRCHAAGAAGAAGAAEFGTQGFTAEWLRPCAPAARPFTSLPSPVPAGAPVSRYKHALTTSRPTTSRHSRASRRLRSIGVSSGNGSSSSGSSSSSNIGTVVLDAPQQDGPHSASSGGADDVAAKSSTDRSSTSNASSNSGVSGKGLLQPVTYTATHTLPPQPNWAAAVVSLQQAIAATAQTFSSTLPASNTSGVLRWEVPLPRGGPTVSNGSTSGFTALQWLQGQNRLKQTLHQVYFSGRHSTAPDTPGTAAAEAAAGGWGSVAGLGAAWLWQGSEGQGFDGLVMSGLQRFLSELQPRLRILGGSRFNPKQTPSAEWQAFGSYLFLLPQVEVLEVDGSLLLSVNCAWDSRWASQHQLSSAAAGIGPETLNAAVQQALTMLPEVQPPATAAAPALAPAMGPAEHTPDVMGWEQLMTNTVRILRGAGGKTPAPGGMGVNTELAKQEFVSGGQQGLDELLSALMGSEPDPPPVATLSMEETEDEQTAGVKAIGNTSDGTNSGSSYGTSNAVSSQGHERSSTVGSGAAGGVSIVANSAVSSVAQHAPKQQQRQQQQRRQDKQLQEKLVKVVLARRTALPWHNSAQEQQQQQQQQQVCMGPGGWQRASGAVLLQALQERDPRAYQLYLSTPPGAAFLACTPERLYVRSGRNIASEAVAGTRPRGPPGDLEADFYQGLDLLQSPKDHAEFTVVRDWIRQQLSPLCVQLKTEVQKSVLKQASVQHLYGRLAGVLRRGIGDADMLGALHPTPAVCGRPREAALSYLEEHEPFDRGFYAGPFGWVSGQGAEFVVAIRSAMLPMTPAMPQAAAVVDSRLTPFPQQGDQLLAYAGVGVVQGSEVAAEWQELCLKVRQFEGLLSPLLRPSLATLPNCQAAWAALAVEELSRLGVSTFAVAPGSRSSPLALAAASHPRSQLTVAIDERSLGFWALGYSRANPTGLPAAVICSSGTAVANLLPAVVEASQSNIPLLLLTADRPYEMRDTGANQTIDQVKLFGGYCRWTSDIIPPSEQLPGRIVVSTVDTAVRYATASPAPGPVHLNFQFRDPLAPNAAPWQPDKFLQGLEGWQQSAEPYTAILNLAGNPLPGLPTIGGAAAAASGVGPWLDGGSSNSSSMVAAAGNPQLGQLLQLLLNAERGLIVVGEQVDSGGAAATMQLAAALGWPVAADVLSNLRVGGHQLPGAGAHLSSSIGSGNGSSVSQLLMHHFDHVLLGDQQSWWSKLQPDVVLQLGPRVTSKRVNQFMVWCALGSNGSRPATPWLFVSSGPERHDAAHLLACHISMTPQQLLQLVLTAQMQQQQPCLSSLSDGSSNGNGSNHDYQWWQQRQQQRLAQFKSANSIYAQLLCQLDAAAAAQIDASLANMAQLSEMAVARVLSSQIPVGTGLFLGNSMPIRDMDMYSGPGGYSQPLAAVAVAAMAAVPDAAAYVTAAVDSSSSGSNTSAMVASSSSNHAPGFVNSQSPAAQPSGALGMIEGFRQVDEDGVGFSSPTTVNPDERVIGSMPPGGLLSWRSNAGVSTLGPGLRCHNTAVAVPETLVGVPVAANRGASGIDGVLSTAAGFAAGLRRPVTLVVGDLSFLHDVNGLSLLRGGEMSPPLTVVLINNKGGGIFSFLPVADSVGREAFERLWGTPQNVDLEGICRAHGIPHQRVTTPADLTPALATAWGINRHSVVEVNTDRQTNLALHKQLQATVAAAVHKAHDLLTVDTAAAGGPFLQQQQQRALLPLLLSAVQPQSYLMVAAASVSSYSLPLTRPLTSVDQTNAVVADLTRRGLILHVTLQPNVVTGSSSKSNVDDPESSQGLPLLQGFRGLGEAAPLPGLHIETYDQALQQLLMLSQLLQGVPVPQTLAILTTRSFSTWLHRSVGIHPEVLYPSVRFALESALLQALASSAGCSMQELLCNTRNSSSSSLDGCERKGSNQNSSSTSSSSSDSVLINGLLPGTGSAEAVVAAAEELVQQGVTAIKVKVGRRPNPAHDAAVVYTLHKALSHRNISLVADANRAWTLEQALQFGTALVAAAPVADGDSASNDSCSSSILAYIEEPTRDPADMAAFYAETGIPVAVDESIEEGLLGPKARHHAHIEPLHLNPTNGLAGAVIKPSVVGGFEAAWELACWAKQQGLRVVISSSFESSVGLSALIQLAAAVDASSSDSSAASLQQQEQQDLMPNGLWKGLGGASLPRSQHDPGTTAAASAAGAAGAAAAGETSQRQQWHGLGTLSWFAQDLVSPAEQGLSSYGARIPSSKAWELLQLSAAAPAQTAAPAAGGGHTVASVMVSPGTHTAAAIVTKPNAGGWHLQLQQQQHVHLTDVQYEVRSLSGVKMTVTGMLAAPHSQLGDFTAAGSKSSSHGSGIGSARSSSNSSIMTQQQLPVVLLHGFMGSATDWLPLMSALVAAGHSCLAVNLPGQGGTKPLLSVVGSSSNGSSNCSGDNATAAASCYTIDCTAAVVEQAAAAAFGVGTPCLLIGYSMGARVALTSVLHLHADPRSKSVRAHHRTGTHQQQQHLEHGGVAPTAAANEDSAGLSQHNRVHWAGAVIVSGTPGIPDSDLRAARVERDAELANMLTQIGVERFLHWWYDQPLWSSLRVYPGFSRVVQKRARELAGQEHELAAALRDSSTGNMGPLWNKLRTCPTPLLLVAGQLDEKFAGINRRMVTRLRQAAAAEPLQQSPAAQADYAAGPAAAAAARPCHQWAEVPGAGHALHIEAPFQLLHLVQGFVEQLLNQGS